MSMFIVYIMVQTVVTSPVNIHVQKRKEAISFHLHSELNVLVDTVQAVKEVSQFVRPMVLDDKVSSM
jgi:hypothetical protein